MTIPAIADEHCTATLTASRLPEIGESIACESILTAKGRAEDHYCCNIAISLH